jgi:type IV fimbrial biogenesis protein FimT
VLEVMGVPMRQRGFTLIELLTVLMIVGIMAGIAVPSFKSFIATQRVRSASYEVFAALLLARSEAINRNTDVTIAPTTPNDWPAGWSVTTVQSFPAPMAVTLHRQEKLDGIEITRAPPSIIFQASGRPRTSTLPPTLPPSGIGYWQVDGADSTSKRCVRMDSAGTISTLKGACPSS